MHVCYFFLQLPIHESWIDYHWTPGSVIFFLSGMLTIRRVWGSLEVQSLWSVHSNQAGTGRLWHAYAKGGHFSCSLSLPSTEKGVHSFSLLVALVSSLLTPKTQIEAPEGDNFLTLRIFTIGPFGNSWQPFAKFPISSYLSPSFPGYCFMEKPCVAKKQCWQPPASQCWGELDGTLWHGCQEAAEAGNHLASCIQVSGVFRISLIWLHPNSLVLAFLASRLLMLPIAPSFRKCTPVLSLQLIKNIDNKVKFLISIIWIIFGLDA